MRLLGVAWYLSLSAAARLLEILSLAPAYLGRQWPLVRSAWWVIYFDERATQVWDGEGDTP
jgi:hypothetical protein